VRATGSYLRRDRSTNVTNCDHSVNAAATPATVHSSRAYFVVTNPFRRAEKPAASGALRDHDQRFEATSGIVHRSTAVARSMLRSMAFSAGGAEPHASSCRTVLYVEPGR
jgi:hypothetical protein